MEQRRIVRRFTTKPSIAEPEDEPEEQQDNPTPVDDMLEEDVKPVVRRRTLSATRADPIVTTRKPVTPPVVVAKVTTKRSVVEKPKEEVVSAIFTEPVQQMPLPEPALEKFRIRTVNETVAGDVFSQMFEAMESGASIIVTKIAGDKWQFTSTNIQAAAVAKSNTAKLTGKAYWDEVLDPAYTRFYAEWDNLTAAERKARAKKVGATWVASTNQKMEAMRMTEAYRDKMKIFKYKPEYRDMKKRAAIRG